VGGNHGPSGMYTYVNIYIYTCVCVCVCMCVRGVLEAVSGGR